MATITTRMKADAVHEILQNPGSIKKHARNLGVEEEVLDLWVQVYLRGGSGALHREGTGYRAELIKKKHEEAVKLVDFLLEYNSSLTEEQALEEAGINIVIYQATKYGVIPEIQEDKQASDNEILEVIKWLYDEHPELGCKRTTWYLSKICKFAVTVGRVTRLMTAHNLLKPAIGHREGDNNNNEY
jgi:transposase-like protein